MRLFTSIAFYISSFGDVLFGSGCTASPDDRVSRSSVSKPNTAGCSTDQAQTGPQQSNIFPSMKYHMTSFRHARKLELIYYNTRKS